MQIVKNPSFVGQQKYCILYAITFPYFFLVLHCTFLNDGRNIVLLALLVFIASAKLINAKKITRYSTVFLFFLAKVANRCDPKQLKLTLESQGCCRKQAKVGRGEVDCRLKHKPFYSLAFNHNLLCSRYTEHKF